MMLNTNMMTVTSTKVENMARKTQLELALLLPEIPDRSDACVQRLIDLLKAKDGVTEAHVTDVVGQSEWQICIHFDSDQVSITEVRELAQRAGLALAERFGHARARPSHLLAEMRLLPRCGGGRRPRRSTVVRRSGNPCRARAAGSNGRLLLAVPHDGVRFRAPRHAVGQAQIVDQ